MYKDSERRSTLIGAAVKERLLHPIDQPLASFIDWERLRENVSALHAAFPEDLQVLHAFAVKANSLVPVLRQLRNLGLGAEVASEGELAAALEAGHEPARIVFDSPAKTTRELARALELGVSINVDNFQELDRIIELRSRIASTSEIGIRLNPQIGAGTIAAMSTAGQRTKFGIPLRDPGVRERLVSTYLANPWLTRAHTHVGSQGCSLELIASGVSELVSFADEVNERAGRRQIRTLDIGGGLPVDFASDEPISRFDDYVEALRIGAPRLFSGDYGIVTEFGRSVLAKHGIVAAFVEYTKEVGGQRIAITHAGAQVATRTVFMPEAWPLRVEVFDAEGRSRTGEGTREQDVAGPCCFAGDLVARGRELPVIQPGDIVALLDTGAYYASTPFSYNSLPVAPVYGVELQGDDPRFDEVRSGERVLEAVRA
ncbi:diaminopimelate decarboxylase [Leucobacter luti]|uniref:diaminopimelate decarboxylase n=1 Tax=Leucobacter luti TaxID=340320 RepID=UPI003D062127